MGEETFALEVKKGEEVEEEVVAVIMSGVWVDETSVGEEEEEEEEDDVDVDGCVKCLSS